MLYQVRGDTIGFWETARVRRGPDGHKELRVSGIRALGAAEDAFHLKIVTPPYDDESALTFALYDTAGELVVPRFVARPDALQGLGSGDTHVLFEPTSGGARIVVDLDRLPRHATIRTYRKPTGAAAGRPAGRALRRGLPAVCFTSNTSIVTRRGRQPVEALEAGEGIWTLDHGIRRLGWYGKTTIKLGARDEALRPIRFAPHSITTGYPEAPVWLAPQHRVLVHGWKADLIYGRPEVLVPAHALTGWDGVARDDTLSEVTYHCLLMGNHEIVSAGGLLCETPVPRDALAAATSATQRKALRRSIPLLKILDGRLCGPSARPVAGESGDLDVTEARLS